jgi:hypothetical protein
LQGLFKKASRRLSNATHYKPKEHAEKEHKPLTMLSASTGSQASVHASKEFARSESAHLPLLNIKPHTSADATNTNTNGQVTEPHDVNDASGTNAPVITITTSSLPEKSHTSSSPTPSPTSTNSPPPDSPSTRDRSARVPILIDLNLPATSEKQWAPDMISVKEGTRTLTPSPGRRVQAHVKQASLEASGSASGASGGSTGGGNKDLSLFDLLTDPNFDSTESTENEGDLTVSHVGQPESARQRGEKADGARVQLASPKKSCCPFKCRKPNFDTRVKDHWTKMAHLLNETHFTAFKKGEGTFFFFVCVVSRRVFFCLFVSLFLCLFVCFFVCLFSLFFIFFIFNFPLFIILCLLISFPNIFFDFNSVVF